MFELHVGETPCELSSEHYQWLAERTEGYSGADIQIVVQDALMQPIRKLIAATHFKPAMTGGEMSPDESVKWIFCSPEDPEAVEKSWTTEELFEPKITLVDFTAALENVRPSVIEEDLVKHQQWTKDFGSDGS
ncbi:Vps4 C terminal oligomerization domain-containing protein [Favolaschia claudopus]|uniref:Vps4 C terminal oligomerization domain-containing protein n=1 Tax=Favolaschia claudopus TaxID=2862362 RepID=A0AAW0AZK0_9AGAR